MARKWIAWIMIIFPLCLAAQDEEEVSPEKQKRQYQRMIENSAFYNLQEYWLHDGDPSEFFAGLSWKHQTYLDWQSTRLKRNIVQSQLELMPFAAGDVVVDIGVGNGSYEAQLMLEGVDHVTFYGLDVDSTVLSLVQPLLDCITHFIPFHNSVMAYVGEKDMSKHIYLPESFSMVTVQNTYESTTLASDFADKMICIRTVHHLSDEFLMDMYRTLKPGGELCIVDRCAKKPNKSKCEEGEKGDPVVYYLTSNQIVERLEGVGFRLTHEDYPQSHAGVFVFEK